MNHKESSSKFKAIIFDFGDVICFWDQTIVSDQRAESLGLPKESIRDLFISYYQQGGIGKYHSIVDFYDRGLPTTAVPRDMANKLFAEMEQSARIDPQMITLISSLKHWYKIGLLSNFPKGLEEYLIDRFHIHHLFDSVVSSYNIQIRKPSLDAFHYSAKDLGVATQQCVFIDDVEKNVLAAQETGMKGLVFSGREELQKQLSVVLGRHIE